MTDKNTPKKNLTEGPVGDHMVRMTIPMIWGILAVISFQLVDTFFVSLLGTQKLAAITFTFPITYFVFALTMGLGIATSSVLSRQIGQGNERRIRRLTTHALLMALTLGVFFTLLGLIHSTPLFRAMGATDEMLPLIHDYIIIWFWGAAAVTIPIVGNAAIRATGNARIPAMIMMAATIINLILDPLLIFGLWGFPRMELQGAAIATVIANLFAAGTGLYILKFKKDMIARSSRHSKLFANSARRFLVIAIPAGLTQTMQPIANAVIIALLANYSASAVAAFGITSRVEAFAMIVVMALSVGISPILGQNWGAKKYDRVHEALHKAFRFTALWLLGTAAVLALIARPLAGLFSEEEAVISYAALFFWIVPITYTGSGLIHVWASVFNATGAPKRSFMLIFTKMIIFMIPLAMIGGHWWGIPGIFGGIALANLLAAGLFHPLNWRFTKGHEAPKS